MTGAEWHPASWRRRPAAQMPLYADASALLTAERALSQAAPIASIEETEQLKQVLGEAAAGRAFLLHGGDCAELVEESNGRGIALSALFERMAGPLAQATGSPVVHLGRIAGQFAKPRGATTEVRGGSSLPIYRGDLINGLPFDPRSRAADPMRMLRGHAHALATKKQLDGLATRLFTSHEALLLPYEEPLVRRDAAGGRHWSVSGHFLWVGDRTRDPDGAHVEFLSGLANPVGVKCGPSLAPAELLRLCDRLDPEREPGRLTLIVRPGAERISQVLPAWLQAVRAEGRRPLWVSDPMHGNTQRGGPRKLRHLDTIRAELRQFFELTAAAGVWPGGLHLEMTPEPVTECLGGRGPARPEDLTDWRSACDPRLNGDQALDLAMEAARIAARALAA